MELHEQTLNKVGMITNTEQRRNKQVRGGTKLEQMMNAATWAFVADFNRAQSWNKVGETLRSKFVQDLRLEQRGNKVSQEWNINGTKCHKNGT